MYIDEISWTFDTFRLIIYLYFCFSWILDYPFHIRKFKFGWFFSPFFNVRTDLGLKCNGHVNVLFFFFLLNRLFSERLSTWQVHEHLRHYNIFAVLVLISFLLGYFLLRLLLKNCKACVIVIWKAFKNALQSKAQLAFANFIIIFFLIVDKTMEIHVYLAHAFQ